MNSITIEKFGRTIYTRGDIGVVTKMATISVYIDGRDERIIKNYAKSKNMSVSAFLRSAAVEKIEDEIDRELCEKAEREFKDNPQDVSLDALEKEMSSYC